MEYWFDCVVISFLMPENCLSLIKMGQHFPWSFGGIIPLMDDINVSVMVPSAILADQPQKVWFTKIEADILEEHSKNHWRGKKKDLSWCTQLLHNLPLYNFAVIKY